MDEHDLCVSAHRNGKMNIYFNYKAIFIYTRIKLPNHTQQQEGLLLTRMTKTEWGSSSSLETFCVGTFELHLISCCSY